ncbi:TTLL10 [Symbiodinium pilosum]|uniref:TTLL10 protein n=1 Tax=Symbiodinium pilosum TaxID=2952 RepID=A0A812SNP7_SYMPI|nr:TTLL10 [Symbiodinium pilosum]
MHGSTLIGPGAKILAKSFAGESPSFVNTFGTSCFKVPSDRKGSLKTKVNGRKCDFRVYLYIPTSVPLVALYSPVFYIRCGHQAFNVSSTDPLNVVTNTKVRGKLREGANYSELVLGPDQLQQQLSQQGLPDDFVKATLLPAMKAKLALLMEVMCFATTVGQLQTTNYELFGIDMMLDTDLNVWLIEVNSSPGLEKSLGARKEAVEAIIPPVVGLQLDLLRFAASGRPRANLTLSDLPSKGVLDARPHTACSGSTATVEVAFGKGSVICRADR